ncbi:peptidoglycan DD-metalloendopeptidase family protein [Spirosoma sp.]|uniref:peptidoglycan DD-metalloendopeptidase family protein n=1 Tax=Spirosoma sp. TaxID=1899569 RepID=UPI003B3AA57A
MTYTLRLFLFVASLLTYGFVLRAQPIPATGHLVGVSQRQQPCLNPSEHADIQRMLQARLALLNRTSSTARKTATHPVFSFPLRWSKSTAPYGFWMISNYVDLNSAIGPNDVNQYTTTNTDYNCGNRTYDQKSGYQHQGTDIALWPFNWSVMAGEYVKVVAAAPGVIIMKSDGNDDQSCGSFASATSNWNAVYIRHDDGSVTWYGHLKKQSLTTKNIGERVDEGEFLGYVGSSGRSSGPHLHFEVYNATGKLIDPFQGACNATVTNAWWKEQPLYKDKTINRLSVHLTQPVMDVCPGSANVTNEIAIARPGQRFYFYAFGRELEAKDSIQLQTVRPDGQIATFFLGRSTVNYSTFYWYTYATIPADAPNGRWLFRTIFNGKVYEKPFIVANDLKNVVQVSPAGKTTVCTGENVTLTANVDADLYTWRKDGTILNQQTSSKIVASESGAYTAELNGAVSDPISITVLPTKLASASLTGNQSIYEGQSAKLSVAFTGDGPWNFAYRDSTATGMGTPTTIPTTSNPYTFTVTPAQTTAYLLTNVNNVCGNGNLTNRTAIITVSPLLGVDDPTLADAVEVYPVPVTSTLTVHIKRLPANQTAILELTDLTGQTIGRFETHNATFPLSLDQQPPGSYVLRIRVGERTAARRIIKL